MPFSIIRQDITRMDTDAIVNAANTGLQAGGGVCGAIFNAAGYGPLQNACDRLAPIQTGQAVITPGFNLKAKYIIHAAGPIYYNYAPSTAEKLLYETYENALKAAEKAGCKSIAFPLISSGIYGYPKGQALQVATEAISDFLKDHEMDVYLAIFDKSAFSISKSLIGDIDSYIDDNYVSEHSFGRSRILESFNEEPDLACAAPSAILPVEEAGFSLDDALTRMQSPFAQALFTLIDEKGMDDVEVYKRANIDRKLFSKIRNKNYTPSKRTILALAIALRLNLEETDALLERAGYALSHANKFDVIVEYFIIKGIYDIFEINEALFYYDQPLLGN